MFIPLPSPPSNIPGPVYQRRAPEPAQALSRPSARQYVTRPGDTLHSIAVAFYGRPEWQRIFNENMEVLNNTIAVYPGMTLTIP